MSDCLLNALTFSLEFGLIAGLLISFLFGPFSAMGRRADTRSGWEKRKKKFGSPMKAWLSLYITIAIPAFLILLIALAIECF